MPTYEVRNRRSKMVVAEVTVDTPENVVEAVLKETGSTLEDLALSLGRNMDEITAALDIVEQPMVVPQPSKRKPDASRAFKTMPPRRRSFYTDKEAV